MSKNNVNKIYYNGNEGNFIEMNSKTLKMCKMYSVCDVNTLAHII